MASRKKLKIVREYLDIVQEWFSFVEKRTSVDTRLHKKIETTKISSDFTPSEIQIVMRWYYVTPAVVRGKVDDLIYKELENFISKQEKA